MNGKNCPHCHVVSDMYLHPRKHFSCMVCSAFWLHNPSALMTLHSNSSAHKVGRRVLNILPAQKREAIMLMQTALKMTFASMHTVEMFRVCVLCSGSVASFAVGDRTPPVLGSQSGGYITPRVP